MSSFKPYLACSASAGSGKTWQLSIRYLAILLQDAPAEEILTLTFTKKATAEMLERITNLLLNIEKDEYKNERKELIDLIGISEQELLEKVDTIKEQFLRSNHKIMTIDAFFNQILKSFALNIGISPLYDIAKIDESEIIESFLREIYRENLSQDLIFTSLLLGRSITNIFEFLQRIYENKIDLTRYDNIVIEPKDIAIANQDAMSHFYKIKNFIEKSPVASGSAINAVDCNTLEEVTEKRWFQRDSLSEYRYFSKPYQPQLDEWFNDLKEAAKKWYRLKEIKTIQTLSKIYNHYENTLLDIKKKKRALNFNDITHLVYQLLTQKIDGEFFYFKLDSRIKHILIDEFQDTSIVQFNIIKPLIEEFVSGEGTASKTNVKSFFYVGDEKQSIYRFRGGNPYLFSAVKNIYQNIKTQQLDTNYRSFRNPIEFTNTLFKDKYSDFPIQKASKEGDGFVSVVESEEITEELINTINYLLANGVDQNKIAILGFTNKDISLFAESIKSERPELTISTETKEKIININSIRSIVEAVKYIYFKNPLYKANFCSLLNLDEESVDLDRYDKYIAGSPYDIVFRIATDFGLFYDSRVELLRFLEWTAALLNIEAFIYGYQDLDTELEGGERKGITAMTIHKSKGLEFDVVIVMDRVGDKSPNKAQLIFDLDGVELKTIAYRFKNREFVDSAYREIVEKQKEEIARDDLNVLYVALTRAKESLFVIKKPKGSSFEMLNIEPITIGKLPPPEAKITEEKQTESEERVEELFLGTQEILAVKKDDEIDIDAINFGIATHYMIEVLGAFKRENLEAAVNATKNRYGLMVDVDLIKKRVEALLSSREFLDLIDGKKLLKEYAINSNGELIRVDLIAESESEMIVIDFKSGSFNELHHKQVKNYLENLGKLTGKKVRGFIVYLYEKTVIKEVL